MTKTIKLLLLILTAAMLVSACASRPELVSKVAVVPAGVDLSGRWVLRESPDAQPLPRMSDDLGIRIPPANRSARSGSRRTSKRSSVSSVQVFLEFGKALKITQTEHGLFISYDRSVVEEFTFGENREVAVGPIEAQRVSGWEGGAFVVQTLDNDGAILSERWRLAGDTLVRDITISRGEQKQYSVQQQFDRYSGV